MRRAAAAGVGGFGVTIASTFAPSLGLTVHQQRIGFVVGVALIVLAAVLLVAQARKPPPSDPPASPRTGPRVGYRGRPGSFGNLSDAEFSGKLDTGIDSEGEVDARRARFGKEPEDEADAED